MALGPLRYRVDLVGRGLDQHRIVDRRAQPDTVLDDQAAGGAQHRRAVRLCREILQRGHLGALDHTGPPAAEGGDLAAQQPGVDRPVATTARTPRRCAEAAGAGAAAWIGDNPVPAASDRGPIPYFIPNIATLLIPRSCGCDASSRRQGPDRPAGERQVGVTDFDRFEQFRVLDRAAAIPSSCADQSMYASARPSAGLISPRHHVDGPKMNSPLLGALRPVAAVNGHSCARLRRRGQLRA